MMQLEELIYIHNAYRDLYTQRDRIKQTMADLEAQGLINAQIYWMRKDDADGKPDQLELTHSTKSDYYRQHGTRREYIGVKPDKIKAALDGIERNRQFLQLDQDLKHINNRLYLIDRLFRNLRLHTMAKQKQF